MAFHAPAPTRVSASDFRSPKAVDTGRHRDLRTVTSPMLCRPFGPLDGRSEWWRRIVGIRWRKVEVVDDWIRLQLSFRAIQPTFGCDALGSVLRSCACPPGHHGRPVTATVHVLRGANGRNTRRLAEAGEEQCRSGSGHILFARRRRPDHSAVAQLLVS